MYGEGKEERMQNGRKRCFLLIVAEGNVQSQQKLSLFSEHPFKARGGPVERPSPFCNASIPLYGWKNRTERRETQPS